MKAWCVLVALLIVQAVLVATTPPRPLGGDEPSYAAKARAITESGGIPRARPNDLAVERGAWGNSDWRPPGYALFLSTIRGGSNDVSLRHRVTIVQFVAIAAATLLGFSLVRRRRVLAAIVLGIAPWPFAFVTTIGPDSLNASIAFFGLFLLQRQRLFLGSLVLSSTLLLRPEMIAVVPIPIAVALLVYRPTFRKASAALAAFLLVVTAQYGYRTWFVGRPTLSLFGGLHIYNAGAFAWVNSWLGTEDEAYDFVYGLAARDSTGELPARAFADAREKRIVDELRARTRAEGFGPGIDAAFAALARERRQRHPITAGVLPRIWHTVHIWLNTETNDQLLHALGPIPRPARRVILGALLLLKLVLVGAFFVRSVPRVVRRLAARPTLTILASFVVARTLLVGFVLNWMVYRYMVVAWLPLIAVVFLTEEPDRE